MTADQKSAELDAFLKEAIAEFSPTSDQTKDRPMARGLLRLKNLTESLMASVDAEAEKVAASLQRDHDEAVAATRSVGEVVGGAFKAATSDVKDMLNQITNGEE